LQLTSPKYRKFDGFGLDFKLDKDIHAVVIGAHASSVCVGQQSRYLQDKVVGWRTCDYTGKLQSSCHFSTAANILIEFWTIAYVIAADLLPSDQSFSKPILVAVPVTAVSRFSFS
jgi:hypothetical protein